MTQNNTPAQPVLTDDLIEALAKKHIAPHADRLDAIMQNPVPYQQTEQFRRVKALIVDVLSKLRAPVAQLGLPDVLPEFTSASGAQFVSMGTVGTVLRAARAALASAPVAGEARMPPGYRVKVIEGHGYRITPPTGGCWVAHSDTPAGDLITALLAAPQASEAVRDAIETCAKICDGRSASLMQSQMLTASSEAHKCGMAIRSRAKELLSLSAQPGAQKECNCAACRPHSVEIRMILCEVCGDKRCPHAADHRNACTGAHPDNKDGGAAKSGDQK